MAKDLILARGSGAIPMTPFNEDLTVDIPTLEKEIDFICQAKVGNITTPVMVSEFMVLSEEERMLMIRIPIEVSNGRTAIIANVAATNVPTAIKYTEYAEKLGADAVIAMAPWCGDNDQQGAIQYFKAIASATSLPVMVQNAQIPGVTLTPAQVVELCDEVPNISWVKQEVPPAPLTLEKVNEIRSDSLIGMMSGFGGFYAPMDYKAGATATIQACEFCDVSQKIWDLLFMGKEEEARELHYQLLPAIQLEMLLGTKFAKEIMVRRGIFKNTIMRNKVSPFSKVTLYEIDKVWEKVQPLFLI